MQFKYIAATIASLAVASSAIPAPNVDNVAHIEAREQQARMHELGTQAAEAIQQIEEQYSENLAKAAEKNYKANNAQAPTLEQVEKFKEYLKSQETKESNGAVSRRDPQWNNWGYNYNNALWANGNINDNRWVRQNFNYRNGWQTQLPFWRYGSLYDYNINNYFTGFGLYSNCGVGWNNRWC